MKDAPHTAGHLLLSLSAAQQPEQQQCADEHANAGCNRHSIMLHRIFQFPGVPAAAGIGGIPKLNPISCRVCRFGTGPRGLFDNRLHLHTVMIQHHSILTPGNALAAFEVLRPDQDLLYPGLTENGPLFPRIQSAISRHQSEEADDPKDRRRQRHTHRSYLFPHFFPVYHRMADPVNGSRQTECFPAPFPKTVDRAGFFMIQ